MWKKMKSMKNYNLLGKQNKNQINRSIIIKERTNEDIKNKI